MQARFQKTKKKQKKPTNVIKKPTHIEKIAVHKMLSKQTTTVCAFCFKEDDAISSATVNWVQCPQYELWAHTTCDTTGDMDFYVCSIF